MARQLLHAHASQRLVSELSWPKCVAALVGSARELYRFQVRLSVRRRSVGTREAVLCKSAKITRVLVSDLNEHTDAVLAAPYTGPPST